MFSRSNEPPPADNRGASRARLAMVLSLAMGTIPMVRAAAPEDSVVKVIAQIRLPQPIQPWIKQNPVEVNGTGVVIEGKRILTCAHLVTYASEVVVQGRNAGDRIDTKVSAIGQGIDLAILTVEEEGFFEGRPPLRRSGDLPPIMSPLSFCGFPVGGNGLSVGRGTLSRIEYAAYDYRSTGLRIQVEAALNPGNSGGPILVNGEMAGLIIGLLDQAQNVGYVIPLEEVDDFLADVADGHFDGKPRLSDQFQTLENPALRSRLGLGKEVKGIMIRKPASEEPSYPLHEFDIVTRIGSHPIDNEAMVEVQGGLRLTFTYLVPKLAHNGSVSLTVIRLGQPVEVTLPVGRFDDRLIRSYDGEYPRYFVHGPLVFSPLMAEAIQWYFQLNPTLFARNSPRQARRQDKVRFNGEELVVVTNPLLRHKISKGYGEPLGQVVDQVDDVKVKNLIHLVETIRDGHGEFLTIRFADDYSETMLFRREEMERATDEVMAENGIPRRGSEDVMAAWNTKSAGR
jgi:S1-C subfamily serine protease